MRFAREMLVPGAIHSLGKKRRKKSVRDNCGTQEVRGINCRREMQGINYPAPRPHAGRAC